MLGGISNTLDWWIVAGRAGVRQKFLSATNFTNLHEWKLRRVIYCAGIPTAQ